VLSPNRNVIFLLGSGDPLTVGRLVASLANRLTFYSLVNNATILPEPTWSLSDFVNACKSDPTTAGALVTTLVASSAAQSEQFIYRRLSLQLAGGIVWVACAAPKQKASGASATEEKAGSNAFIVPCVRDAIRHLAAATVTDETLKACTFSTPQPSDHGSPQIAWVSPVSYSNDQKKVPEPLQLLTAALAVFTVYETFRPSVTTMSGSTTVYPVTTPIPRSGSLSSVTTSGGQTSNPSSGLGALATALYSQNFGYSNTAASLPIADEQSWRATNGVVTGIVTVMNCKLKPMARQSPGPRPLPPDNFFPSRYDGKKPDTTSFPQHDAGFVSAPFCADS
jgi:hypothetical protein